MRYCVRQRVRTRPLVGISTRIEPSLPAATKCVGVYITNWYDGSRTPVPAASHPSRKIFLRDPQRWSGEVISLQLQRLLNLRPRGREELRL